MKFKPPLEESFSKPFAYQILMQFFRFFAIVLFQLLDPEKLLNFLISND